MVKISIIFKEKAHWRCQRCNSSEFLAAHHQISGDDSSIIVLCGECHSKEHPNVPKQLFFSKKLQPYWHNKSAGSIAKELGLHFRTIIRRAKKNGIAPGLITTEQLRQISYPCPKPKPLPELKPIKNLKKSRIKTEYQIHPYHRGGNYFDIHLPSRLAKKCGIMPTSNTIFAAYIKENNLLFIEQVKEDKDAILVGNSPS